MTNGLRALYNLVLDTLTYVYSPDLIYNMARFVRKEWADVVWWMYW